MTAPWHKPHDTPPDSAYAGDLAGALGGGAMLGTAGAIGADGVEDLRNNRVALSYGRGAVMGAGHKEPAKQLALLLDEIKSENRGNFLGKLDVVHAPVEDYDGRLLPETLKNLKGRFLTGMDTGWGLFDPERDLQRGSRPGFRDLKARMTGDKVLQRDPLLLRKFRNFLSVQVDGRGENTGYMASGDARRIADLRGHRQITYGDFDPEVARYMANNKIDYVGRAHPLVELKNLNKPLARDEYQKLLSRYLQGAGYQGVTPEMFDGKQIITASGASRGDTVGAKARWAVEQIKADGRNLDDYVIVGVGGAEDDLARNLAIAHAGGKQPNIFIGPKLPSPAEFVDVVNNGDLHLLGMGGSAPPEMLAHGGSRLAIFDDEQIFRSDTKNSWSGGNLQRRKGLHGFERKLIKLLNKALPAGQRLAESPPRDWMNQSVHGYGSKAIKTREGLDGIRLYGRLRGALGLQSDNPSSFLKALDAADDSAARGLNASLTRADILGGRSRVKDILIDQLRKGKASATRLGTGKLALGAGLLSGGGALLSKFMNRDKPQESMSSILGRYSGAFPKQAADTSDVAVGGGLGAAALGAGMIDTGIGLSKLDKAVRPYVRAVSKYTRKYPGYMNEADPTRIREFLRVMDQYADAAKTMSGTRIMGIPAHYITRRFPLTGLADPTSRGATLLHGFGLDRFIKPEQRWDTIDSARHYQDMAKTPRQTLAREMLSRMAGRNMRVSPDVAHAVSYTDALKIVGAPETTSLGERFSKYINDLEAGELDGAITADRVSPFRAREARMLRGLGEWDDHMLKWNPRDLRNFSNRNSIKSYGLRVAALAKKAPKLTRLGILTSLLGAGTTTAGILAKNREQQPT